MENSGKDMALVLSRVRLEFVPYLEQVFRESSEICGDKLRSVILFGSLARGEFSESVSDVDLLFIVSDDTPHASIEKLDSRLERFEFSAGPSRKRSHFLWVFASRTALFKSHFIIRYGTLLSLDAKRLFEEAEGFRLPLGGLPFQLAPKSLVVTNILSGAVVIWGENVLSRISPTRPPSSLGRVFVVSLVLSLFGALSSLLFHDGTFFSLEAVKWFLLDTNPFSSTGPKGLKEVIITAQERSPSRMLRRFTSLRERYQRSVMFSLACPFYLCHLSLRTRPGTG